MKNFDLQFLLAELNRVSEWIRFSDRKSAFLAVYYSTIFGLVIYQKGSISQNITTYQDWPLLAYILVLIGIILSFIIGVFFLVNSVFPRTKNSYTSKSLFYFGHVANMKLIDYFEKIEKLSEDEAKKQIIEQIYSNSTIADQKMKDVQSSTKGLIALGVFTVILLLF